MLVRIGKNSVVSRISVSVSIFAIIKFKYSILKVKLDNKMNSL